MFLILFFSSSCFSRACSPTNYGFDRGGGGGGGELRGGAQRREAPQHRNPSSQRGGFWCLRDGPHRSSWFQLLRLTRLRLPPPLPPLPLPLWCTPVPEGRPWMRHLWRRDCRWRLPCKCSAFHEKHRVPSRQRGLGLFSLFWKFWVCI